MVSESWQPGDLEFSASCIPLHTAHRMHGAREGQEFQERGEADNDLSNEQEDRGQAEVYVTREDFQERGEGDNELLNAEVYVTREISITDIITILD